MPGLSSLNFITRISRRSQDSPLTVSRVRRETQWREPICELALFRRVCLPRAINEWFRLGFFCSPGSWSSHQDGGPSCASSSMSRWLSTLFRRTTNTLVSEVVRTQFPEDYASAMKSDNGDWPRVTPNIILRLES